MPAILFAETDRKAVSRLINWCSSRFSFSFCACIGRKTLLFAFFRLFLWGERMSSFLKICYASWTSLVITFTSIHSFSVLNLNPFYVLCIWAANDRRTLHELNMAKNMSHADRIWNVGIKRQIMYSEEDSRVRLTVNMSLQRVMDNPLLWETLRKLMISLFRHGRWIHESFVWITGWYSENSPASFLRSGNRIFVIQNVILYSPIVSIRPSHRSRGVEANAVLIHDFVCVIEWAKWGNRVWLFPPAWAWHSFITHLISMPLSYRNVCKGMIARSEKCARAMVADALSCLSGFRCF